MSGWLYRCASPSAGEGSATSRPGAQRTAAPIALSLISRARRRRGRAAASQCSPGPCPQSCRACSRASTSGSRAPAASASPWRRPCLGGGAGSGAARRVERRWNANAAMQQVGCALSSIAPHPPGHSTLTCHGGGPPDVGVARDEQVTAREARQMADAQQQREVRRQRDRAEAKQHRRGAQNQHHVGAGAYSGKEHLAARREAGRQAGVRRQTGVTPCLAAQYGSRQRARECTAAAAAEAAVISASRPRPPASAAPRGPRRRAPTAPSPGARRSPAPR